MDRPLSYLRHLLQAALAEADARENGLVAAKIMEVIDLLDGAEGSAGRSLDA